MRRWGVLLVLFSSGWLTTTEILSPAPPHKIPHLASCQPRDIPILISQTQTESARSPSRLEICTSHLNEVSYGTLYQGFEDCHWGKVRQGHLCGASRLECDRDWHLWRLKVPLMPLWYISHRSLSPHEMDLDIFCPIEVSVSQYCFTKALQSCLILDHLPVIDMKYHRFQIVHMLIVYQHRRKFSWTLESQVTIEHSLSSSV